jgi:hypothetical protein
VCSLGLNMVKDDFFSVIKEIPAGRKFKWYKYILKENL